MYVPNKPEMWRQIPCFLGFYLKFHPKSNEYNHLCKQEIQVSLGVSKVLYTPLEGFLGPLSLRNLLKPLGAGWGLSGAGWSLSGAGQDFS